MEVGLMPYRMPDNFSPHPYQPYTQYHDLRTHPTSALAQSAQQAAAYQRRQPSTPSRSRSPNSAPDPPDDPNKPSLPSISNLLGIADGDRETATQQQQQQQYQQNVASSVAQGSTTEQVASAPYAYNAEPSTVRQVMPPTPPMRTNSMPEPGHSPSTISSAQSSISGPSFQVGSSLNNVDAAQQRVYIPMGKPHTMPLQPVYGTSPYGMNPYMASPTTMSSSGSYYSPENVYGTSLYQQRPLPSNFPPAVMAAPVLPPGAMTAGSPWEHHHYIAHGQASFPSIQDRYVCQTCKKAFSRPSSLKIHSHSHTGEKPFKCPHAGCGKAFSVRSNMKRHERGCHAGDGSGLPPQ